VGRLRRRRPGPPSPTIRARQLYRNDGGRFVDVAAAADGEHRGRHVGELGLQTDGWMDLYVGAMSSGRQPHHLPARFKQGALSHPLPLQAPRGGNSLFETPATGHSATGVVGAPQRVGPKPLFTDINNDGWDDIVVVTATSPARTPQSGSFFWRQVVSQSPKDAFPRWSSMATARGRSEGSSARASVRGEGARLRLPNTHPRFATVSATTGLDSWTTRAVAVTDWTTTATRRVGREPHRSEAALMRNDLLNQPPLPEPGRDEGNRDASARGPSCTLEATQRAG
jgi:hypothetical protein